MSETRGSEPEGIRERPGGVEYERVGQEYMEQRQLQKNLREAQDLFAGGEAAKVALGEEVVEHYLNVAWVELEAFEAAVTDWERYRNLERL